MKPTTKRLLERGKIQLKNGDTNVAIKCLESALSQSPTNARILKTLAEALQADRQYIFPR